MSKKKSNPECCCAPDDGPSAVENRLILHLGYDRPRMIVNGLDIAPMVDTDWRLDVVEDHPGIREAKLTVTFPVYVP